MVLLFSSYYEVSFKLLSFSSSTHDWHLNIPVSVNTASFTTWEPEVIAEQAALTQRLNRLTQQTLQSTRYFPGIFRISTNKCQGFSGRLGQHLRKKEKTENVM